MSRTCTNHFKYITKDVVNRGNADGWINHIREFHKLGSSKYKTFTGIRGSVWNAVQDTQR